MAASSASSPATPTTTTADKLITARAKVASDPTMGPSLADLKKLQYTTVTSAVATPDQIKAIAKIWVDTLGLKSDQVAMAAWDVARAYADIQASRFSELEGPCPVAPDVPRASLVQAMRLSQVTPRQFCMYFAKVVWNILLSTNTPPALWQKLGYTDETKFAAFDFFDGVSNPAALDPVDGLIREPTELERAAHNTAKYVALYRTRAQRGNAIINVAEVTAGRISSNPSIQALPAP